MVNRLRSRFSRYITVLGTAIVVLMVFLYVHFIDRSELGQPSTTDVDHTHSNTSTPPNLDSTNQPNYPPRKQQIAWTEIQIDDSIPISKWPRVPDHAVFVSLNDRFDQWLLHTPVEIRIPHSDRTYHALVDRITPNGLASTTIRASPDPDEHDLKRLILTFGEDQTLAYISTNQGSWELTGDGQIGWLVSTTELKRARDYSESDVINEHYDRYADAEYVPRRSE